MTFLVDANVVSELTKPMPSLTVVKWLRTHESELALNAIVLGEISLGILALPVGKKRRALERWFGERVESMICLAWDADAALEWARLMTRLRFKGTSMPLGDSMIAASALRHDLTVATRNTRDFANAGVRVINPFD